MKEQKNRLETGGRIDRSGAIRFLFDGKPYQGYSGDTLAAALIANGVDILGRSFKYHRPRGIYAAGVEEPNALVTLRSGGRGEPNTRATSIELYEGLEAISQNRWPSIRFDVMALNGLLSPFFLAGFYYKTFIGPGPGTKFWMICEKFIRRAAGMGTATKDPDPDEYEKRNAFCDVLVIGAGPAGLVAALAAAGTGARVLVVEQQNEVGGSLREAPVGAAGDAWRRDVLSRLRAMQNVRILIRTTAFGAYDHGTYGLVERVWDHVIEPPANQPRQRYWLVRTQHVLLASGAMERPILFGGNDLPGVMSASAARAYVNRFGVLPGRRVIVFTNNDSAYTVAVDLARVGASVTLIDCRRALPVDLRGLSEAAGLRVILGCAVLQAKGGKRIKSVIVGELDSDHRIAAIKEKLPCDLLCISGGWTPTIHLWSQRGGKPTYDEAQCAFLPVEAVLGMTCLGACAGSASFGETISAAFSAGRSAAHAVLGDKAGESGPVPESLPEPFSGRWHRDILPLFYVVDTSGKCKGKAFVDLQNDVTTKDIDLAFHEGYVSAEHLKRYTTQGMATDQGKTSNVNALALMAQNRRVPIPEVGITTFRPPFTPISIGAIVGREHGRHFHPTRLSPLHDWHTAHGAVRAEAGAWLRAWYYPQPGESLRDACIREAAHVRTKVGLVDISTLGKIAVQGPDAAEFLNRIYVNGFKTLAIGRIRYGVMLREDGFVMDDGTTARLGEDDYFMTTTTTNAAKVLANLEFLLQTTWKNLRAHVTTVTDQWAAIAVAGPQARRLLTAVMNGADISSEALPNMCLVHGGIGSVPVRMHRMSYSGEPAYEIYIPSGFGRHVWETLIEAGKALGVAPYGIEAMSTLRIEKGHVAGPELDGRTTLRDLALEGFASRRKPFVGSVLRKRSVLTDPARPSLVGLEVIADKDEIEAGSILFPKEGEIAGHGEGHVTSATFSPALGKYIALGLLARGPERYGEELRVVNILGGSTIAARVTSPCFFDPEGVRMNA